MKETILEVRYIAKTGKGLMRIDCKELLATRQINRVKKLMRIIRQSETPECTVQLERLVKESLEEMKHELKYLPGTIIMEKDKAKERVTFCENRLADLTRKWEVFRECKHPDLKMVQARVKVAKTELSEAKARCRRMDGKYKNLNRDGYFYDRVLELIMCERIERGGHGL